MSEHDPAATSPAVELREMRLFLTLAEELHYGRTAERLLVTPARVSQTIQTLEAKVGGRLFERTSRRVRLTPLGAEFDARLRPIYLQLISTVDAVSTRTSDATGSIRIGVTINTGRPVVDRLLTLFGRQHPECDVSLQEVDVWEPYEPLRQGEIDVLCNWLAVEEPDLTSGPVIEECNRVLVVASDHPLAQRQSVTSDDFAGERLNRPPKRYPRALADAVLLRRSRSGRPLHRTEEELEWSR
jgi:DNA-binding transcriptional LysR family regulator